ncbi:MAG: hypothetical protein J2P17_00915 [Mycobacterium sp.]|nr:hypothetical protein [Mycobacterium sp.]
MAIDEVRLRLRETRRAGVDMAAAIPSLVRTPPARDWALLRRLPREFVATLTRSMRGEIRFGPQAAAMQHLIDGRPWTIAQLAAVNCEARDREVRFVLMRGIVTNLLRRGFVEDCVGGVRVTDLGRKAWARRVD